MSYSFGVRAATKTEAADKATTELDKIVSAQPVHEADRAAIENTVAKLLNVVRDDSSRDVGLSVSGSVYKTDAGIESVSLNVSVHYLPRT